MTAPLITWHQSYPGGRMVAMLGRIEVGAVFPDAGGKVQWALWLPKGGFVRHWATISAKSELAAQNALIAAVLDWLRAAGLEQTKEPAQ